VCLVFAGEGNSLPTGATRLLPPNFQRGYRLLAMSWFLQRHVEQQLQRGKQNWSVPNKENKTRKKLLFSRRWTRQTTLRCLHLSGVLRWIFQLRLVIGACESLCLTCHLKTGLTSREVIRGCSACTSSQHLASGGQVCAR
jgi:hypothetical protein